MTNCDDKKQKNEMLYTKQKTKTERKKEKIIVVFNCSEMIMPLSRVFQCSDQL